MRSLPDARYWRPRAVGGPNPTNTLTDIAVVTPEEAYSRILSLSRGAARAVGQLWGAADVWSSVRPWNVPGWEAFKQSSETDDAWIKVIGLMFLSSGDMAALGDLLTGFYALWNNPQAKGFVVDAHRQAQTNGQNVDWPVTVAQALVSLPTPFLDVVRNQLGFSARVDDRGWARLKANLVGVTEMVMREPMDIRFYVRVLYLVQQPNWVPTNPGERFLLRPDVPRIWELERRLRTASDARADAYHGVYEKAVTLANQFELGPQQPPLQPLPDTPAGNAVLDAFAQALQLRRTVAVQGRSSAAVQQDAAQRDLTPGEQPQTVLAFAAQPQGLERLKQFMTAAVDEARLAGFGERAWNVPGLEGVQPPQSLLDACGLRGRDARRLLATAADAWLGSKSAVNDLDLVSGPYVLAEAVSAEQNRGVDPRLVEGCAKQLNAWANSPAVPPTQDWESKVNAANPTLARQIYVRLGWAAPSASLLAVVRTRVDQEKQQAAAEYRAAQGPVPACNPLEWMEAPRLCAVRAFGPTMTTVVPLGAATLVSLPAMWLTYAWGLHGVKRAGVVLLMVWLMWWWTRSRMIGWVERASFDSK